MPLLGNIPTSPYRSQATATRAPFRVSKKRQKILIICLPYFCDVEERGAFPESCVSYKRAIHGGFPSTVVGPLYFICISLTCVR